MDKELEGGVTTRDVLTTYARWGRERGDVQVVNRLTGEVVVISYGDLTPVWKIDLARAARAKGEA